MSSSLSRLLFYIHCANHLLDNALFFEILNRGDKTIKKKKKKSSPK